METINTALSFVTGESRYLVAAIIIAIVAIGLMALIEEKED